jgi:hypothetical protein
MVKPDRPQITISYGASVLHAWELRLQSQLRMFNNYFFPTATLVTRTHSVLHCTHIACVVMYNLSLLDYALLDMSCCELTSAGGDSYCRSVECRRDLQWRVFAVLGWGWGRKVRLCISLLLLTIRVYKKRRRENITATISSLRCMCMCVAFKELRSFRFSCFA